MRLLLFLLAWLPLSAGALYFSLDPLIRLLGLGREGNGGHLLLFIALLALWAVASGFAWELVRRRGPARSGPPSR